jgi:hypothetical protein
LVGSLFQGSYTSILFLIRRHELRFESNILGTAQTWTLFVTETKHFTGNRVAESGSGDRTLLPTAHYYWKTELPCPAAATGHICSIDVRRLCPFMKLSTIVSSTDDFQLH